MQADIWSFGVCVSEIYTAGSTPYSMHKTLRDVLKAVNDGFRMPRPSVSIIERFKKLKTFKFQFPLSLSLFIYVFIYLYV